MARTRTLAQLQADLTYLSDAQNLSARHDTTNQTRVLNQAIQRFREKLSIEGITHYLQPYQTTTPVGATAPFPFAVLDLASGPSPALVRVYQVHVTVNNRVYQLEGIEFTEITRYQDEFRGVASGPPLAFASQTTTKLCFVPPPSQAFTCVVWYLPVLADLSAPGDSFDGVAGWEDWVVYQAAMQLCQRDRDGTQFSLLTAERDRVWSDIIQAARKPNRASQVRRRDTYAERRERLRAARWRLP